LKEIFKHSIRLLLLPFLFFSCDNPKQIDTTNFLANYERDKFIPADTTAHYDTAIDNSGGWTISLKNENQFIFRGTNKIVKGNWFVNKKDGDDYFITFTYESDTVKARLNETIIYFDRPHQLFDSLFRDVIFVKTTRKIE
jgi:hypothetical protein